MLGFLGRRPAKQMRPMSYTGIDIDSAAEAVAALGQDTIRL